MEFHRLLVRDVVQAAQQAIRWKSKKMPPQIADFLRNLLCWCLDKSVLVYSLLSNFHQKLGQRDTIHAPPHSHSFRMSNITFSLLFVAYDPLLFHTVSPKVCMLCDLYECILSVKIRNALLSFVIHSDKMVYTTQCTPCIFNRN